MALSVGEIRRANKEYYSEEYVKKRYRLKLFKFFLPSIVVIISQLFVFGIKHMILKKLYDIEAGNQDLGNQETQDWINQQIQKHQLDHVTIVIIITIILMVIVIVYYNAWKNNYESYKEKEKVLKFLVACVLVEAIVLFSYVWNAPFGIVEIFKFSASVVSNFIAVLAIIGAILPFELKAPVPQLEQRNLIKRCILKCINWLTDYILKNY